ARYRMARATSSGSAKRPDGADRAMAWNAASSPPSWAMRSWKKGIVFQIGVLTPVGETALTRMLSPARRHSRPAAFENWMTAALLAQYALADGKDLTPETDATLTILPPRPWRRIARMACLVPRKTPSRLTARTRRQSSRLISGTGQAKGMPAQLTATSS